MLGTRIHRVTLSIFIYVQNAAICALFVEGRTYIGKLSDYALLPQTKTFILHCFYIPQLVPTLQSYLKN
ncbi:hypothetical protein B5X24_HaOG203268 [Helicoverpa armigera]|nr:hypothetical protein B5X24_HaOG203268 [Helicoverpa armigera]